MAHTAFKHAYCHSWKRMIDILISPQQWTFQGEGGCCLLMLHLCIRVWCWVVHIVVLHVFGFLPTTREVYVLYVVVLCEHWPMMT